MSKLTDRQRKQLVAEYVAGDGNISQRTLAIKYGVSQKTVSKILSTSEVRDKVSQKKAENDLSMLAYLESRVAAVQDLIDEILDSAKGDIVGAPLRDKMGALKILSETFTPKDGNTSVNNKPNIRIEFVDKKEE